MKTVRTSDARLPARALRPIGVLVAMALAAIGCSGAELLIKTPAESACTDAGLRGCPEIAKGLVAFLDGDQTKGNELVAEGAAQNSPEELRQLADGIMLLSQIPGASKYAGPIVDVAQLLRTRADSMPQESASVAKAKSPVRSDDAGGEGTKTQRPSEASQKPASAELVRRAGHVLVLGARHSFDCVDGEERGTCARLAAGPLVVSDVSFAPECGQSAALVAVVQGNDVRRAQQSWSVFGATSGAAWPVDEGELLIARVAMREGEDRSRCTVSWAGHTAPTSAGH